MEEKNNNVYEEGFFMALSNKELIENYDRLFKGNLSECLVNAKKQNIHFRIDNATGHLKSQLNEFRKFYEQYILTPTLLESSRAK